MKHKKPQDKPEKQGDKFLEWLYKDSDYYDWSGKLVEKGVDVRRKGSDR